MAGLIRRLPPKMTLIFGGGSFKRHASVNRLYEAVDCDRLS